MREKLQTLQRTLRETAKDEGINLFGVADITMAQDFVCEQGGDYLKNFPRAISIAIRLLDAIVDGLSQHEDPPIIFTYRGHYNSVNTRLDQVALQLSKMIEDEGYKAYPIPASQRVNPKELAGTISHKLAAHLAGLGWIGKSCLLITPEYGPRVRFATIMTNAPLETGSPIANGCGECRECVEICPVKAFTGVPFDPSEPREVRFKAALCEQYSYERRERLGEGLCGLCVYICPYGRGK